MRYLLAILFFAVASVTAIEAQILPVDRSSSRARVALVLSGGGARGGAHIGVLRELEKAGVPIDLIVGTSYGAFIGGLYAVGYSTDDLELIVKSMDWTKLLSNKIDRRLVDFSNKRRQDRHIEVELDQWTPKLPKGLQVGPRIQQLLDRLTAQPVLDADNDFDKLRVRFRAVATDILTGSEYVFKNGSLSTAIRASIAAPGLLTPVELDYTLLIDGGIANVLPIDIAVAEGADLVIAVNVSRPLKKNKEQIISVVDVMEQVSGFYAEQKKQLNLKIPAIVITPELEGFNLLDFDESYMVIERGAEAAEKALPEIARQLAAKDIAQNSAKSRTPLLDPTTVDLDKFTLSDRVILLKEISVEGLQKYPEPYILGYLSSQKDLRSSVSSIDRDVSALYATGLFDSATFQLWRDGTEARLIYKLHERAPVKIGLSARYDQDYKFTGLIDLVAHDSVTIRSDLFLKVIVGGAESIELGVNRKHLFGMDLLVSSQIGFRSRGRLIRQDGDTLGDYQDRRFGFQSSLQYPLANWGRIDLAYLRDHIDIDRGLAGFIQPTAKNLAGFTSGVRFDSLDDAEFPTVGSLGKFELEWRSRKVGSDFSYSRSTLELDHYFSPTFGSTIGLTTRLGLIDGTAPFYERFYTGGAQKLSFASARFLGLERDEILSERVGIAGISFRHPLRHFESGLFDDLYLNVEYKGGFFSREDPKTAPIENPIHGFGIGLHFNLHVLGPILIELGQTSHGSLNLYFSFGSSF